MNVTVENLAPCKKLVRVEVDAQKVDEVFESIMKDFRKHAALPGFRPGKAPREMVLRKYDKDIQDEAKRKLISDAYRDAVKEHKLEVLGYPDIEEIQFGRGKPLQFAATIETAPEFELPEYKGLPVKREARTVTDEDVERALGVLVQQQVSFKTVERPAQAGDIAVVNYTGTCDGKPITDIAPAARGLTEQKNFWVEMEPQSFIPGFSNQLLGSKAGDKLTVNVDFPADFVTPQLAGRKGAYEVELVEVKEKVTPPLDDAFAKSLGAETLEALRAGVRKDLEGELAFTQNKSVRGQLVRTLLDRVQFDLPESAVAQETRNVVYDIVMENQKRGVSREKIEQEKENIYSAATQGAKGRVKGSFLMQKIAEKEGIKVTEAEVGARIQHLSAMYQIPLQQFIKDLEKRNGVMQIVEQLTGEKVVDFLQQHAQIEEVPPGTLSQPQWPQGPANPA